jgi:predicted lipid-binding transport protein (Tim44 family)
MIRLRYVLSAFALLATLAMLAGQADARPAGGGGFGSRGSRTFSAPPATRTAPNAAVPLARTQTPPTRPNAGAAAAPATGGLFGRPGLMGGLFAGFLGAGLFGMLFGHGLFGGLGGLSSVLGLLLQVGLIVIVGRLAWAWWQRRQQGLATAGGPSYRDMNDYGRNAYTAASAGAGAATGAFGSGPVTLEKADYDAFERNLSDVTVAYAAADLPKLARLATPEMVSFFEEDITRQKSRGLVNQVSDIHLLQGDLAEAWRESDNEYATVAMNYSLVDVWVDGSGAVVDGSREPQEVTEHWTFVRNRDGAWLLSAIQES